MIEKIKRLIPSKRKIMQLYFALLFNANLKGFVSGNIYQGNTKQFCAPGINCYSCPGAVAACPLGSLQGSFSAGHSTIFYVFGILLLYGLVLGRMICGWLCPFGLVQELMYKVKTPKLKKSPVTRILSYLKYVILIFFVIIVPVMYAFRDMPLPAFCKYICPAGTLEGGIGLLANKVNASYFSMLGPLFTWKFALMVSILVGSVFIFRLFCRFLCPLGALYGLFNRFSFFGVGVKMDKCTNCGLCKAHCKLDIHRVADQECISCGECIDVCPTNAIHWKGTGIFLRKNEGDAPAESKSLKTKKRITRSISAVVLLAILIGSVAYYWNAETPPAAEQGNEVGDLCYGRELEIIDGSGSTGQVIDPTATGRITVINFWATWCTPCINELPYFNEIAKAYEDVSVIAIHASPASNTAPGYIAEHYADWQITFSVDPGTSEYYTALGGRGTYPYTLVLDENGIITSVFFSSVTYDDLASAIEKAK